MTRYVLDSFAMIAFFEDEPGAQGVDEILRRLIRREAEGFMSVVNWGELYYCTMREQGAAAAESVIRQMEKYPIELIAVDRELTYEAAKLKAVYKIAYADCFAAALSVRLKAKLLTGDPEFQKLTDRVEIDWIRP